MAKGLIPRGLRVRIMPSFVVEDIPFKTKWEEACNLCSKSFIELLIGNNKKSMDKLDSEIESTRKKLFETLTSAEMETLNKDIENQFVIWEKEVKDIKMRKFQRDLQDFNDGTVYRWQQTTSRSRDITRSSSLSSVSSREEEGGVRTGTRLYNLRHNSNRRRGNNYKRKDKYMDSPSTSKLQVINLSDVALTEPQIEVLSLGLSFSPTASFDLFSVMKDLNLFARKLVLKKLHEKSNFGEEWTEQELETINILEDLSNEQDTSVSMRKFVPPIPKKFPPLNLYPNIELFVKMVSNELQKISSTLRNDNLTKSQRKALKELKGLKQLVIKPADKGGNVVVWPTKQYEKEALRQLRDPVCYKRLTYNPTSIYLDELQEILEQAFVNGTITKQLRDNLIPAYPRMSCIYFIPKIHKNQINPPGRPIVSGNGSLCETVCKYLDFHLKPLVYTLPSYIRDTGDFLSKIEGIPLENDIWFVTLDVESLYTSIHHNDGIRAVRTFLAMTEYSTELIEFLIILLEFSLTHNFFIFKEIIYLQNQGTAMGAAFAPSYANLFLGAWERNIFFSRPIAFIEKVLFWVRFIDDIFLIWQGTEQDLLAFLDILNDNEINVRLTCKYSQTSVEFLDVLVNRGMNDQIETNVHRKETAVNSLLHASSSHPKPLINGIPTGQFLRIKRICSNNDSFKAQAEALSTRFVNRGYSKRCIKRGWKKANSTRREDLLQPRIKSQVDSKVRFISTYSDKWPNVKQALNKYWPMLTTDRTLTKYLSEQPSITYRRSHNLKDLLVHSYHTGQTPGKTFGSRGPKWGFYPCNDCIACPNMLQACSFQSSDGKHTYTITQNITCNSIGVVYYAVCPCGKIYVGLTSRPLKIRVREHYRDIMNSKDVADDATLKPVPRHFKRRHNSNAKLLKVIGIDKVYIDQRGGGEWTCRVRRWFEETSHPDQSNGSAATQPRQLVAAGYGYIKSTRRMRPYTTIPLEEAIAKRALGSYC
ncbi:unnamed protein product [Ranitomeya imitator]|uniref:Reverse transcriptase domain-containing protein n=1 Tax=Ranitomeya imitator TaxID=111125 RepID=A0ABN9M133_9NEOB|nr:unnamed protein product [Ranitomeya imitator]